MRKLLFLLLLFQLVAFAVYRDGIIDYPKYDHARLLLLRESVSSDWEWFRFLLHHRDSKDKKTADHFMFRPGLNVVMATTDYFFREHLAIIGAFGIFWHGLATLSLYLLLRFFLGRAWSFSVAMLYTAYFPGLEMVNWRHISPYLLSLAGGGGGLWLLWRSPGHPREKLLRGVSTALLLGACLFYEIVTAALLLLLVALFLLRPRAHQAPETPAGSRGPLLPLAAALTLYCAGLALTLDYAALPDFLGNLLVSESGPSPPEKTQTPFFLVSLFSGNTLRAFVTAPWLQVSPPNGIPDFGLSFISRNRSIYLWALFFWGGLGGLAWKAGGKVRKQGFQPGNVLALFACFALGTHGLIMGVREYGINPTGNLAHMAFASYNHAFSAYFFCLVLGLFLAWVRRRKGPRWKRRSDVGVAVLLLCYAVIGSYRISSWLRSHLPAREKFAEVVSNTATFFEEHPEYYFGGVLPLPPPKGNRERPQLPNLYPHYALLQRYALPDPDKQPLYLSGTKEASWLVTADFAPPPGVRQIVLADLKQVKAQLGDGVGTETAGKNESAALKDKKTADKKGKPRKNTIQLYDKKIRFVSARIEFLSPRTEVSQFVFDYRHPKQYHLLSLGNSRSDDIATRCLTWNSGKSGAKLEDLVAGVSGDDGIAGGGQENQYFSTYFPPSDYLRLDIVRTDSHVLFFRNDRLVLFMPVLRWGGRMALTSTDPRPHRTLVMAVPDSTRNAVSVRLEQIYRVWPPSP